MARLEVDLKLVADQLEPVPLALLVPHEFVMWNARVCPSTPKILAGGAVVHVVICVGISASAV